MDELLTVDERAEDELDAQEAGSTFFLGGEGWEASDYVDPGGGGRRAANRIRMRTLLDGTTPRAAPDHGGSRRGLFAIRR